MSEIANTKTRVSTEHKHEQKILMDLMDLMDLTDMETKDVTWLRLRLWLMVVVVVDAVAVAVTGVGWSPVRIMEGFFGVEWSGGRGAARGV